MSSRTKLSGTRAATSLLAEAELPLDDFKVLDAPRIEVEEEAIDFPSLNEDKTDNKQIIPRVADAGGARTEAYFNSPCNS